VKDVLVEFIVNQAADFVRPDGNIELIDVSSGVARVRYDRPPDDPRCATCVLTADDVSAFLKEMFGQHVPYVSEVEVEVVQAT